MFSIANWDGRAVSPAGSRLRGPSYDVSFCEAQEGHTLNQFTRNVQFDIKPGKGQEFKSLMDRDILPIMRKQDGFRGELALVNENHAVGISCWDTEQHAETYRTNAYPKVLESLKSVIEGTPSVETYDVASTTFRS